MPLPNKRRFGLFQLGHFGREKKRFGLFHKKKSDKYFQVWQKVLHLYDNITQKNNIMDWKLIISIVIKIIAEILNEPKKAENLEKDDDPTFP